MMTLMNKPSARLIGLMALVSAMAVMTAGCDKLGGGAGSGAASAAQPKAAFKSVDITGANYAQQFSLPDSDGKKRSLADFKGKAVFVFFGFTQCPEVCPTTMVELAEVKRRLGKDGDRLQGVFITLDPERDTPEVLKEYLKGMDPSFIGLRGTLEETNSASREFKVFYQKVPTKEGQYTIDHTAGAFVFDPSGQIRLFVRYGLGVDALTADIKQLLGSS